MIRAVVLTFLPQLLLVNECFSAPYTNTSTKLHTW